MIFVGNRKPFDDFCFFFCPVTTCCLIHCSLLGEGTNFAEKAVFPGASRPWKPVVLEIGLAEPPLLSKQKRNLFHLTDEKETLLLNLPNLFDWRGPLFL